MWPTELDLYQVLYLHKHHDGCHVWRRIWKPFHRLWFLQPECFENHRPSVGKLTIISQLRLESVAPADAGFELIFDLWVWISLWYKGCDVYCQNAGKSLPLMLLVFFSLINCACITYHTNSHSNWNVTIGKRTKSVKYRPDAYIGTKHRTYRKRVFS